MSKLRVGRNEGKSRRREGRNRRERGRNGRKRCRLTLRRQGGLQPGGVGGERERNVHVLSVLVRSAQDTGRVGRVGEALSRSTDGLRKNKVERRYRAGTVKPTSWAEIAGMAGLGF